MQDWHAVAMVFGQAVTGATFAASLTAKARDPGGFAAAVAQFRILPQSRVRLALPVLFGLEAVVVALLVAGALPAAALPAAALPGAAAAVPVGLGLAVALLAGYTAALVAVRVRGMRVSCHCFGASPATVSWYDVARNLLLIGCAAVGLAAGVPAQRLASTDAALVAMSSFAAALLIANLADVVSATVRAAGTE